MRVLVTGAAGFIGSHLCERLVAEGHDVRGLDGFTDYYDRGRKELYLQDLRSSERFELIEADLATAGLHAATEGVEAIFHLAAQPGVRGSWGASFDVYLRDNVLATQRLLEAMLPHRPRFVLASSSSVYGQADRLPVSEEDAARPISPYGVTKLAAEHLATLYRRAHELSVVTLRYFTVYGPRQRPDMALARFLEAAVRGVPLEVLGNGEQSRDFTFVGDAVDATVKALGAPSGSCYNVGGGSRATVNEVVAMVEELLGRRLEVHRRPAATGDALHTWADTTRIRQDLGWKPATGLREGLRLQVEWTIAGHPPDL